ncbi:hypothetical protein I6A60_00090 [Frankia sp. AgB1.9]|uniref:hypothetical protein n=1 Tax=unclassified Frankia TaxID=2632575 RepID=UPI0019347653|nr:MULTISPECIES: hypothetical protein [unclassified Frankia]MBL7487279.1 hypothetical protein [Frankia sp. AgW1.1]MBL7546286.1 hypothetical protein [Frankia sp. AgB1.9]
MAADYLDQSGDGVDASDVDLVEALDRSFVEALSAYDPDAAAARFLSLRFSGDGVDGRLPERIVEEVLAAFRRELAGAVPSASPADLQLDLVGFSRGSAVLHLAPAPVLSEPADRGGQPALLAADPVDSAVRSVADLHDAAEGQQDMRRFADRTDLLHAFVALTDALERHGVDLDVIWRSAAGTGRRATLTKLGRAHVRRNLERREAVDQYSFTGRVVELNINGSFSLKLGVARNSTRVEVDANGEERLLALGLRLGETITVTVLRAVEHTNLGIASKGRYTLLVVDSRSASS